MKTPDQNRRSATFSTTFKISTYERSTKMPSDNSTAARDRRRTAAAERQKRHDALSTAEKLAQIADRPGKSKSEAKRLEAQA